MIDGEKAPKGIMISDTYQVELYQGDMYGKSDVYLTICPDGKIRHGYLPEELKAEFNGISDGGPDTTHLEKAYYTGFTADGETTVKVKINQEFDRIDVIDKEFDLSGNVVVFKMSPGEKTIITVGEDLGRHLCISCDTEYDIPKDAENLIELTPGIYNADNCEHISLNKNGFPVFTVPDNSTVYLHRGAVINAAVFLENAHNIKLVGSGIVSTIDRCYGADKAFDVSPRYSPLRKHAVPAIYIKTNSSNISVEGLTLSCEFRGIAVRNSKNITVDNVNIFTGCINADGVNMINTQNMLFKNSMVISDDDNIALFTNCDSIAFLDDSECKSPEPYTANIEIDNCILATSGRTFCIGGHSTGNTTPHDLLENFYAHNIRAFRIGTKDFSKEHAMFWSGPLRILSQSEQYIRNIKLEGIKLSQYKKYCGKLIHVEVRSDKDASYTETNGFRIENVEISDVEFSANADEILPCVIKSQTDVKGEGYCIDGVLLKNITIGGEKLINSEKFLMLSGPVKNLIVE